MLRRLASVVGVMLLGGCNIAGPAFVLFHGPPRTKPLYVLDKERSTVIFIDDRNSILPDRALRRAIGATAEQDLLNEGVVRDVISSEAILAAANAERFGRPMSIVELGDAVGASVVIYATVDGFSLSPDGVTFAPAARLRMKVMDVESATRAWPKPPQEWHVLAVEQPQRQGTAPTSLNERRQAQRRLAERVGGELAKVFYEHVTNPSESRVGTGTSPGG